jgi:hypothetical protein
VARYRKPIDVISLQLALSVVEATGRHSRGVIRLFRLWFNAIGSAAPADPAGARRFTALIIALAAGALAFALARSLIPSIQSDDAAIAFRYAERLANGRGFTYNDHERGPSHRRPEGQTARQCLEVAAGAGFLNPG